MNFGNTIIMMSENVVAQSRRLCAAGDVLSPYSEISLEEKLKILNLENQKSFFSTLP